MPRKRDLTLSIETLQALDRELTRLARSGGRLRYSIGLGLQALFSKNGHHALGFSSIEAYALERCERAGSWASDARQLVVKTQGLPLLREALISSTVSWSMALELVKVATPADEASWLERAAGRTVAEVRRLVKEQQGSKSPGDGESLCTLTITADTEDTWLFECVRLISQQMDGGTTYDTVDSLVNEALSTLNAYAPSREILAQTPGDEAQLALNRQRAECRDQGERQCEGGIPRWNTEDAANDTVPTDFSGSAEAIDALIRQVSGTLEGRDTRLGELAETFCRANGPRLLGYASDEQYARERLGTCFSSVGEKRRLMRRWRSLPHLARALHDRDIGYEAARAVARVATAETDAEWAAHARARTIVDLREDIAATEQLSRVAGSESVVPPTPQIVYEWRALRSAIITGAVFRRPEEQKSGPPADTETTSGAEAASDTGTTADAGVASDTDATGTPTIARNLPPHLRSRGRETLRIRVSRELRDSYRKVERFYLRRRQERISFLRFACIVYIDQWAHVLPPQAYADIYMRDGLRCTNPTCCRRDITPHHNHFRSHGGGDEPWNVTSLCVWCHLKGVHEGLIKVKGRAPYLEWTIGKHTTVEGRTRRRAA